MSFLMYKAILSECRLSRVPPGQAFFKKTKILLFSSVLLFSACSPTKHTTEVASDPVQKSIPNKTLLPVLSDGFEINLSHPHSASLYRLDIYEDPLCPYCGEFERSDIGQEVTKLVSSGKIDTHYHMANFLDPSSSSGKYSSIVDGLLLAIYQADLPDSVRQKLWLAVHSRLYAKDTQPKEEQQDLSQSQLVEIIQEVAKQQKISPPESFLEKIRRQDVYSQGKTIGSAAHILMKKKKVPGTPDIYKNNNTQEVDMDTLDVAGLDKLVGVVGH